MSVVILPAEPDLDLRPMTPDEAAQREMRSRRLAANRDRLAEGTRWLSASNTIFDGTYRHMARAARAHHRRYADDRPVEMDAGYGEVAGASACRRHHDHRLHGRQSLQRDRRRHDRHDGRRHDRQHTLHDTRRHGRRDSHHRHGGLHAHASRSHRPSHGRAARHSRTSTNRDRASHRRTSNIDDRRTGMIRC